MSKTNLNNTQIPLAATANATATATASPIPNSGLSSKIEKKISRVLNEKYSSESERQEAVTKVVASILNSANSSKLEEDREQKVTITNPPVEIQGLNKDGKLNPSDKDFLIKLEIFKRSVEQALDRGQLVMTHHYFDLHEQQKLRVKFTSFTSTLGARGISRTYTSDDIFKLKWPEFFDALMTMYTPDGFSATSASNSLTTAITLAALKCDFGFHQNTISNLHDVMLRIAEEHGVNTREAFEEIFDRTGSKSVISAMISKLEKHQGTHKQWFNTVLTAYKRATEGKDPMTISELIAFLHTVYDDKIREVKKIQDYGITPLDYSNLFGEKSDSKKGIETRKNVDKPQDDYGRKREERNALAGAALKKRVSESHSLMSGRDNREKKSRSQSRDRSESSERSGRNRSRSNSIDSTRNSSPITKTICEGCGFTHAGGRAKCFYVHHPDFNKEGTFRTSRTFSRLQSINPEYKTLRRGFKLNRQENGGYSLVKTSQGPQPSNVSHDKYYNSITESMTINISYLYENNRDETIKAKVQEQELKVLLDTGALTDNFVSKEILKTKLQNIQLHDVKEYKYVKSIHGIEKLKRFIFLKPYLRTSSAQFEFPNDTKFLVIENGPTDLTIGLRDIRKYDLTMKLRSHFAPDKVEEEGRSVLSGQWASLQAQPLQAQPLQMAQNNNKIYAIIDKDQLLDPLPTTDPIDEMVEDDPWSSYFNDAIKENETTKKDEEPWTFDVHGNEGDKAMLLAFLEKNKDIFSREVKKEAAKLPPFKIELADEQGWRSDKRSREYTRPKTTERETAIRKFIRQAIADNVIKPSQAPAWSQILLTKKPNGKWRFCLDYRTLNRYTKK